METFVWFIRAKFYLIHNFIGSCYHGRYSSYLCSGSAKLFVYLDVSFLQCCFSLCFNGRFRLLLKSCGRTH